MEKRQYPLSEETVQELNLIPTNGRDPDMKFKVFARTPLTPKQVAKIEKESGRRVSIMKEGDPDYYLLQNLDDGEIKTVRDQVYGRMQVALDDLEQDQTIEGDVHAA